MLEKRRHTQHLPGVAYLDMHSVMNFAYVNLSFSVYHRGGGEGGLQAPRRLTTLKRHTH